MRSPLLRSLLVVLSTLIFSSACGSFSVSGTPVEAPPSNAARTPQAQAVTPEPTSIPAPPTATLAPPPAPPDVRSIEPNEVYLTATTPVTFTVQGENLNDVEEARLEAENADSLVLDIQQQEDTFLILALDLSAGVLVEGEMLYTLQLNGESFGIVALRDFREEQTVQGVKSEYTCLEAVQTTEDGTPFAALRESRDNATATDVTIIDGDTVQVLTEQDGLRHIRIAESHNPALVGRMGWADIWLIDNVGVPACPTPTPVPPTQVPTSQSQPQTRLVQIPHMPGVDVEQARRHLQSLGFSVSVHERAPGLDHDLCNGWVSFTSPPERSYVAYGSHVKIFYRNVHQENLSWCR